MIDMEASLKRMQDAVKDVDFDKGSSLSELEDSDILALVGTIWGAGGEIEQELRAEVLRRARIYVRELLDRENLIVYTPDAP